MKIDLNIENIFRHSLSDKVSEQVSGVQLRWHDT